jgi:hypothetical protein
MSYGKVFPSNNKLYRHVRGGEYRIKEVTSIVLIYYTKAKDLPLPIIELTVPAELVPAFGFKN